ncbi:RNA polymerase sigma factor [Thalassobacillus hwangdonensis]|uniref:RNA polymerase sigma factor n=1 Tax=Thalassobacillus hwangdonensis TaxID=546108 RepID=A0ABW3L2R6_9BACI
MILTEKHIHALYTYCISLTSSTWDAEDLVQETILKAYVQNKVPRSELSPAYLKTTAKHLFIDRKRKERPGFSFDETLHHYHEDFTDFDSLIEALIHTLPLKQAMLVMLKDGFGYTSKEISFMLRVRDEAVKTALHRARKKLPATIDSMYKPEAPANAIAGFAKAVKTSRPEQIFYYYRLLDAHQYKVGRGRESFYITDIGGNVLQITTSKKAVN